MKTKLFYVLFIVYLLQAGCNSKPEISSDKIINDLNGKSITLVNSNSTWEFKSSSKIEASEIRSSYNGDKAEVITLIETEEPLYYGPIKIMMVSVKGDIKLKYEWYNSEWKLMRIENISLQDVTNKK